MTPSTRLGSRDSCVHACVPAERVARVHEPRAHRRSRRPRIPVDKQSGKYRIFGKNATWCTSRGGSPGTIPNAIETRWSRARTSPSSGSSARCFSTPRRAPDADLNLEQVHRERDERDRARAREARRRSLHDAGQLRRRPEDHEGGRLGVGSGGGRVHGAAAHRHHVARAEGRDQRDGAGVAAHGRSSPSRCISRRSGRTPASSPASVLAEGRRHDRSPQGAARREGSHPWRRA
jgi:hypothetical protein